MKKKKSSGPPPFISKTGPHNTMNRHNIPVTDLFLYARSFHTAAKKLAGALERDSGPFTDFNACPVVFIYRHAVELHLKALVLGDGGNFLATKPDALSVHKTHSVPWLAQFVCQIITALNWEGNSSARALRTLYRFQGTVIEELNAVDPGSYLFRLPVSAEPKDCIPGRVSLTIRDFARRIDAILELLDFTADALAAEWDMRSGAPTEANGNGGGFEPTIQ